MLPFSGKIVANAKVNQVKESSVVNFTIVLNYQPRGKKGGPKPERKSTFIDCAYWNAAAIAPYLTKGSIISLSGYLYATIFNKRNGEAKPQIKLTVDKISFIDLKKNEVALLEPAGATTIPATDPKDDLPF